MEEERRGVWQRLNPRSFGNTLKWLHGKILFLLANRTATIAMQDHSQNFEKAIDAIILRIMLKT